MSTDEKSVNSVPVTGENLQEYIEKLFEALVIAKKDRIERRNEFCRQAQCESEM